MARVRTLGLDETGFLEIAKIYTMPFKLKTNYTAMRGCVPPAERHGTGAFSNHIAVSPPCVLEM